MDATALAGSGRAALSVVERDMTEESLFQAVLDSDESLTMHSGVVVDSFDSELGSYESQATNVGYGGHPYAKDGGHVASNSDTVLNANAVIFGDATPGPGHTVVDVSAGCMVTGSKQPAPTPFSFPTIGPPAVASGGPFSVPNGAMQSLGPGTYGFEVMTLSNNSKLTITGPATLVENEFTGGRDPQLLIDAKAGPDRIFVQGDYRHISGFECHPVPGSPMALAFMVQGNGDVVFPSRTPVRGGCPHDGSLTSAPGGARSVLLWAVGDEEVGADGGGAVVDEDP